ncbi:hybrid-cluster NAD(P)-dependent oxidoreductase [Phycicoccus sp. CSK15P-2]|uniref:hybrid-cluster NAD(P)-dependent oxidoreductase n=1 Tax=Phycicoccus sp. CSK15P-2 TaxID=2807627 RepID=UPI0019524BFD|nr:hybrid-cluster NAD(P)-dependent oxidoreductase [Phycicoccus sp. CSK15P-2]MBM6405683.1 hybrid-cluster NAD(P)-dependent oxidoreductase [Phycicoccus sp. CSK15P-2]
MTQPYHEPATPAPEQPHLRVVPDLPTVVGAGVLPDEEPFDEELVCRRVLRVTHDVVSLVLEPTTTRGFAFVPGQYLTLVADVDGETVERCYTISSPPTRPHLLTVTVKRVPGGRLSPYLHERFGPGDRVRARGPLGGFSVAAHPARTYLLLSAGSGITPTLSTLRTLADLAEPVDVVVVHHARTPADLVCRAEVEAVAAAHGSVRVVWVCEDDASPADGLPRWDGPRGRVGADQLAALVPDLATREVLTCGPPGYMAAVREVLTVGGADPDHCHEESFVLGTTAAPVASAARTAGPEGDADDVADQARPASIRFARSGREVACPAGTTVLEAAAAAGVGLPSSCAEGLCGTCTSTLLAGSVDMNHQGGIRPREVAQNKFLPCCSTPVGDIVVDA